MEHKHHPKEKNVPHSHGSSYQHRVSERGKLTICLILTGSMMVAEFIGGFLTNSLALLSDAGHMLTHSFALAVSFFAIVFATKSVSKRKTFGFYRIEILAALLNGIVLILIAGYIISESFKRFVSPEPIATFEMLVVAVIGLIVNIASVFILSKSSKESINVKSAFLHMVGDTVSSVAVIIGGIVMYYTDWYVLDAMIGIGIGGVILIWAGGLLRDSINILLEATPKYIDIEKVITSIKNVEGVRAVHDVHIWEITSKMYAMTAHVAVADISVNKSLEILKNINSMLDNDFDIGHTNIQFEVKRK